MMDDDENDDGNNDDEDDTFRDERTKKLPMKPLLVLFCHAALHFYRQETFFVGW